MEVLQDSKPDFEGFCELEGRKLAYELRGLDNLEKLIVIQGAFCTRRVFGGVGRALSDRFCVLLFDPRGIGHSTAGDHWDNPCRCLPAFLEPRSAHALCRPVTAQIRTGAYFENAT